MKKLIRSTDLRIVFVAMMIIIAAQIGFVLNFDSSTVPLWPPIGVAFALVLLMGYRIWPGIFIGGLIVNTISFINQEILISLKSITAISVITIGNVTEVLVGYLLYRYLINDGTPYDKTSSTFKFLFISLSVCLIGAATNTISLFMIDEVSVTSAAESFIASYLASVTGLLLFTNLIMAWVKGNSNWDYTTRGLIQTAAFTVSIVVILYLLNSGSMSSSFERSFPFIVIPFLLWAAFSSNIQTAVTWVVIISLFSVWITINGAGPFELETPQETQFLLQIFIGVLGISTIVLSASVYERMDATKKIEAFNETLEAAVEKRTKELDDEIKIRRKTENKIRVSNTQLRKINSELDNFVYKVSHDLRTPISSILGLVHIAKLDATISNMKDCLDQIEKSAEMQDEFIKDIIELSKNSRTNPSKDEIHFKKMITDTFNQLKHSLNGVKIKPTVEIKQEKPFYSDSTRLKVIFNNLLSNSIKYGKEPGGKIGVHIDVHNGHANILVEDNGKGIEQQYQANVFDMFYRATDKNAGSGLGLYIVKETVEKLKGEISLKSEVNQGTSVRLKLPNREPKQPKA